jgi:hypothetical protein
MPPDKPEPIHDWTLLSIAIDWKTGAVTLHLVSPAGQAELHAEDCAKFISREFNLGDQVFRSIRSMGQNRTMMVTFALR